MPQNQENNTRLQVTVARSAGFCFGVKRAVQTCYEQAEGGEKPVYTYGPIIHNELVVDDLKERGVMPIRDEAELSGIREGTVIIRSHGVPKRICDQIEAQGLKMVDATCPFVKRIHRIVQERTAAGWDVIIIGKATHPEVEGICGWACPGKDAESGPADAGESKPEDSHALDHPQVRAADSGYCSRKIGCSGHPQVRVIETEEEALALVRTEGKRKDPFSALLVCEQKNDDGIFHKEQEEDQEGSLPAQTNFSERPSPGSIDFRKENEEGRSAPELTGGRLSPGRGDNQGKQAKEQPDEEAIDRRLCIVSQTTFQPEKFNNLVEILKNLRYSVVDVLNTICNATEERQSEARSLAASSDAMLVIGGRNSSNTQKLYEICKKECPSTFFIQKLVDLDIRQLPSCGCLGITAGASTPNNLIEEVSKRCQK